MSLPIFLALLIRMISRIPQIGDCILFAVPSAALVSVLLLGEFRIQPQLLRGSAPRFVFLLRMCVPSGVGAALPLAIFLIPYARAHALGIVFHDLFAQAAIRITAAYKVPYEPIRIIPTIAFGVELAVSTRLGKHGRATLTAYAA